MRLLLDTHALIWWLAGDPALSKPAREAIADPGVQVFVSAASAMEIATKHRIGKLPHAAALLANLPGVVTSQGFLELPISIAHAMHAGGLRIEHKDPFDRFLIAQALLDGLWLVSNKAIFDNAGVSRLW